MTQNLVSIFQIQPKTMAYTKPRFKPFVIPAKKIYILSTEMNYNAVLFEIQIDYT